jgi:hypothetical protein
LPSMTPGSMSLQICNQFRMMIKTAGMCHMCRRDFAVHLGQSLSGSTPLYTETGRANNLNLYHPQTYAYLISQFTQPSKWFQAYYNYQIISHCSFQLDPSTARWGRVPQAHPWWSSIQEADADLLDSYSKGVDN